MDGRPPSSPADAAPVDVDSRQPIDREAPLKKKRSLKRLFSLSRQSETKPPSNSHPPPPTAFEFPPALPEPMAGPGPQVITSDEVATPASDAWSHKRSISLPKNEVLKDRDANANGDSRGQESRSSTSTTRSNKITNFSRPARDRRNTLSVDETRSSSRISGLQTTQRSSQGSRPSVTLSHRQSNERLSGSPVQIKSSPPRPHTATLDGRSGLAREIPRVPFLPRGAKTNGLEAGPVGPMDEVRESMRSGVSEWSSGFDVGSTKPSSVFTKMSSIRDSTTTTDISDTDQAKNSMSADDAIGLPRGFEDIPIDLNLRQGGTELDQRTFMIAEAINEPLGRSVTPKTTAGQNETSSSRTLTDAPGPPPLRRPTETHDQYGFRKASREVTVAEHNAWWKDYSKTQARRTSRWISMMKSLGLPTTNPVKFPQRSSKVQRYVRKGVPPMWRGDLWYFYAGGQAYADRFPGLYDQLVASTESQLNIADREAIDRDINRTFPDNLHFKPEQQVPDDEEPALLGSLRRLLYAFAIHHPRIGYCQSLNFLAGLLLLFLSEEKAFWLLHIVTARYLPGTHEVSLEGANVDLWVLMLALKNENPGVWAKIGGEARESPSAPARLPPVSLCTTPWFMSLFIGTLPIESVLRVWDLLFYDGSPAIFRAALSIFRIGEGDINRVHDPMEIFQVVQTLPRKLLDATTLMAVATRRGGVSGLWLEARRRERRAWYADERAAEQRRRQDGEAVDGDDLPTPRAADTPSAPLVMRHLSAARSAGDLSRTKSKGLFGRRASSRAGDREPVPPLKEARPPLRSAVAANGGAAPMPAWVATRPSTAGVAARPSSANRDPVPGAV